MRALIEFAPELLITQQMGIPLDIRRYGDDRGDATVIVFPDPTGVEPTGALLHDVWVHPRHRRTGLARRMLTAVCADADRESWELGLVVAGDPMDGLTRFFGSFRFRVVEWQSIAEYPDEPPRPVMLRRPAGQPPAVRRPTSV